MSNEKKTKEHADFQSSYRRSSNFGGTTQGNENLKAKGDGEVKLNKDNDMISKENKQKIADAMDKMQRKYENTEERETSREEE
ncbi:hypothetical protein [Marinirhabdus gelatinilytica]|uniref:Uncharacterized protein n=1 Tax=Marinirhabdus gelatinilytica TaxID=1703343 RepID=A0A370QA59_9FLAO|nr:hypothetical protein [Marinirhabdus gelatinilytica]RDK85212.1 hypothetical protein C8D94_10330 [Marinirhabdus gelatinilytica]